VSNKYKEGAFKLKKIYAQSTEEVLNNLGVGVDGLTSEAADKKRQEHGLNKLKEGKKPTLLQRFLTQLKDPMLIILMAAAAVSAATSIIGGESLAEVAIILIVVLLNAILGVVQESKAEAAIEALQTMAAATCKVIRDGKQQVVNADQLVPGDVVVLEAGDAVPADGRIIENASLKIEEAALTGESVPVNKMIDALNLKSEGDEVPLGDRKNMVYMGSTVVYGRGKAVITETGMNTEMGKIAGALASAVDEETPLQKKLSSLGKTLSKMVLGICVFIFAFNLFMAGSLNMNVILETFMVAVSLAVAAIPEGLATVVTVVLSIGVTNMSKRNAVIRKLTAVETLGCTQVICSDKTGTLTQNKMTVVDHIGETRSLCIAMALCSDANLDENGKSNGEPTEAALVEFAGKEGFLKHELQETMPRVDEAPFDSMRKMMSTVHKVEDSYIQFTKGAPDEVLRRCTHCFDNGQIVELTTEKRAEIMANNKAMADKALRVLAAAERHWDEMPSNNSPEFLEQNLIFIGLTGMIDPVRPEVKDAINECRSAGIRPVMITGDHIDTAVAIAKELGIISDISEAITGAEMEKIPDDKICEAVKQYGVYARVQPEHKTRIVNAWKKNGYIVSMTGKSHCPVMW
jgi:Ca2+-transporting ATPase